MIRFFLIVFSALYLSFSAAKATEAGWALLRDGGQIVLMRHGYAAGHADAPQADAAACRTQRGLSERGQQQARRIGSLFAARAEPVDEVYTSRSCRTRETADLAFGRGADELAALDPTPDGEIPASARDEIKAIIRDYAGGGNLVFMTHEPIIRALTGSGAREGEAVIVRLDGEVLRVVGRVVFN